MFCNALDFNSRRERVWWRETEKRLRKSASIRHDERRMRFYQCFFFQGFLRSECLGFRLLFLRLFITCHTRLHFISSLYNAENHLPCFLIFLQTVLCNALDFISRRGRGWWRDTEKRLRKSASIRHDERRVRFHKCFSSRGFYGVSVSACFFYAYL